jgi:hypothetical protein
MAKRKRTNNDLQNITHKTKNRVTIVAVSFIGGGNREKTTDLLQVTNII